MTATPAPLRKVSDTWSSTRAGPNALPIWRAAIITGRSSARAGALLVVLGIAFFHVLEQPGQQQRHDQIERARDQERRGGEIALHDAARGAQDIVERQHVDERSILDQRDGLVAQGGQ